MTKVDLPFVEVQRGRDGVVRYYFRHRGRRWRLPGAPLSEEFTAAYRRLLAETQRGASMGRTHSGHGPGSFGGLVRDYLASGDFREKKQSTQAEYRRILEALADRHGQSPSISSSVGTFARSVMNARIRQGPPILSCAC